MSRTLSHEIAVIRSQMTFKISALHALSGKDEIFSHQHSTAGLFFGKHAPRKNELTKSVPQIFLGIFLRASFGINARDFLNPRDVSATHLFVDSCIHASTIPCLRLKTRYNGGVEFLAYLWVTFSLFVSSIFGGVFGVPNAPQPPAASVEQISVATSSAPTWHVVFNFATSSGISLRGNYGSDGGFRLQGKKWRINYSCTPGSVNSGTTLTGYIDPFDPYVAFFADVFAVDVKCPTTNTIYYDSKPAGQYFLTVLADPRASYAVAVEDYY